MSVPYGANYADFYDLFYRDKPYEQEAAFLDERMRRYGVAPGGRILELACGTGEHAVRLARRGYAVTATDYSHAMVGRARQKADREQVAIAFAQCDMRELPAPVMPFDAAFCLFDSIGYVQTDAAVGTVLDGVWRNLRPEGLFIVEFWHAPAMTKGFDPLRVRRFKTDAGTILRISETELERDRALAHVTYNVYDLRDDLTYRHIQERHSARYFGVAEMEALARRHGFTPLAAYDGFCDHPSVTETWHVVALWQKQASVGKG